MRQTLTLDVGWRLWTLTLIIAFLWLAEKAVGIWKKIKIGLDDIIEKNIRKNGGKIA